MARYDVPALCGSGNWKVFDLFRSERRWVVGLGQPFDGRCEEFLWGTFSTRVDANRWIDTRLKELNGEKKK